MVYMVVFKFKKMGKDRYTLDGTYKNTVSDEYCRHIESVDELCIEEKEDLLRQNIELRKQIKDIKSVVNQSWI